MMIYKYEYLKSLQMALLFLFVLCLQRGLKVDLLWAGKAEN